jgi:hypothetical protein
MKRMVWKDEKMIFQSQAIFRCVVYLLGPKCGYPVMCGFVVL